MTYAYVMEESYGYNDIMITGVFGSLEDALDDIQKSYEPPVTWREYDVREIADIYNIVYHLWYVKAHRRAAGTWPILTRWEI